MSFWQVGPPREEYFPYGSASDRRDARNRYRYIGVERDEDTGLCMTGPRTYEPQVGRFLQGDPLADAAPVSSAFSYCSGSPGRLRDAGGNEPNEFQMYPGQRVIADMKKMGVTSAAQARASIQSGAVNTRYIYSENVGVIDLLHFLRAAEMAERHGPAIALAGGEVVEIRQQILGDPSAFSYEDLQSNLQGVTFAEAASEGRGFLIDLQEYFGRVGATDESQVPFALPFVEGGVAVVPPSADRGYLSPRGAPGWGDYMSEGGASAYDYIFPGKELLHAFVEQSQSLRDGSFLRRQVEGLMPAIPLTPPSDPPPDDALPGPT